MNLFAAERCLKGGLICKPDQNKLRELQLKHQNEQEMQTIISNIIIYVIYALLIGISTYGQRHPLSYYVTRNIESHFVDGPEGFSAVSVKILYDSNLH